MPKLIIYLLIFFASNLYGFSTSSKDVNDIQMICIDDKEQYCKGKNRLRFNDGCNDCVCEGRGAKCEKQMHVSCKYKPKNVDEAFVYCEKIAAKNKKMEEKMKKKKKKNSKSKKKYRKSSTKNHTLRKHNKHLKQQQIRPYNQKTNKIKHYFRKKKRNKYRSNKKEHQRRKHAKRNLHHHHHRNKNRKPARMKQRMKNKQKYKRKSKPIHKLKYNKERSVHHSNMLEVIERIIIKQHRVIQFLRKEVKENRYVINYLKRKLIRMMRYNDMLAILQRQVADLMIANRNVRLKLKKLSNQSVYRKNNGRSSHDRSHRLNKLFRKMFKTKSSKKSRSHLPQLGKSKLKQHHS